MTPLVPLLPHLKVPECYRTLFERHPGTLEETLQGIYTEPDTLPLQAHLWIVGMLCEAPAVVTCGLHIARKVYNERDALQERALSTTDAWLKDRTPENREAARIASVFCSMGANVESAGHFKSARFICAHVARACCLDAVPAAEAISLAASCAGRGVAEPLIRHHFPANKLAPSLKLLSSIVR